MAETKSKMYLELAGKYANHMSGCTKVKVGCCIVKNDTVVAMGANRAVPDICKHRGCLRVELYGDNSKEHRNPGDCRAIHSEIDAISKAARNGINLEGAVMYVTRYPCEACARAIAASGISYVVYGRNQPLNNATRRLLESCHVGYHNDSSYVEEDTTK